MTLCVYDVLDTDRLRFSVGRKETHVSQESLTDVMVAVPAEANTEVAAQPQRRRSIVGLRPSCYCSPGVCPRHEGALS